MALQGLMHQRQQALMVKGRTPRQLALCFTVRACQPAAVWPGRQAASERADAATNRRACDRLAARVDLETHRSRRTKGMGALQRAGGLEWAGWTRRLVTKSTRAGDRSQTQRFNPPLLRPHGLAEAHFRNSLTRSDRPCHDPARPFLAASGLIAGGRAAACP